MTEQERVQRFETSYNRIDHALAEIADDRAGHRKTFAARVRIAANRVRRLARDADFLLEVGELRNALVHNRLGDGVYIAVPNEQTVLQLEAIERSLLSPQKVIPTFQRAVKTLDGGATLSDVWRLMRQAGFSHYPVYERGTFLGLLTSNGLARWTASRTQDGVLHVDGRKVAVRDILPADHRRDCAAFVRADSAVDDLPAMFQDNPRLEAVIITPRGTPNEAPLGVVFPADLIAVSAA
jgi:hypothetical protein